MFHNKNPEHMIAYSILDPDATVHTVTRIPVGDRAVDHQIIHSKAEGHHCTGHYQLAHI